MPKDYKKIQMELELITGSAVTVDQLRLKSFKIKEIVNMGYLNYQSILGAILLNPKRDKDKLEQKVRKFCIYDNAFQFSEAVGKHQLQYLAETIKFFLEDDYQLFSRGDKFFFAKTEGEKNKPIIIRGTEVEFTLELFLKIKETLEIQHGYKKFDAKEEKVSDLRKKFEERKAEAMRRSKKTKAVNEDEEEHTTLPEMISALGRKGNEVNLLNIPELTLYQFYDTFQGTRLVDNYNVQTMYLAQGAEIESDKRIDWAQKIE